MTFEIQEQDLTVQAQLSFQFRGQRDKATRRFAKAIRNAARVTEEVRREIESREAAIKEVCHFIADLTQQRAQAKERLDELVRGTKALRLKRLHSYVDAYLEPLVIHSIEEADNREMPTQNLEAMPNVA